MLETLRRKLTWLVIGILVLISAGLMLSVNETYRAGIRRQAYASLDAILENDGQRPDGFAAQATDGETPPKPEGDERRDPGQPRSAPLVSLSNSYTVWLDESGAVTDWVSDRAELYSDAQIAEIAALAQKTGKPRGRIGSQYYALSARPYGAMLAVIDARSELAAARRLLISTSVIAVLVFAALSLGAVLLIRRMLRPVREAFEKQKRFVWDASHELKTPLAVIAANADVLAAEAGESESLSYIRAEIGHADALIRNLLTLARMDDGAARARFQTFDLGRTLLGAALPFESTVFEAGKTLKTDVPDGVLLRGDAEMIGQLATILLSNALKYADAGSEITLFLRESGAKRVFGMHNFGPAIPPDEQPRVFDRFFRGSAVRADGDGCGLGLSIAQTIVRLHRGTIAVKSTEADGTTFTVTMPG